MVLSSPVPPHSDDLLLHRVLHRVAVANIAAACRMRDSDEYFPLAIRNDSALKAGRIEFGSIGGGAVITPAGASVIQSLGTASFEPHDDGISYDARITLSSADESALADLLDAVIQTVKQWCALKTGQLIELHLRREMREEFVDDKPPLISLRELGTIDSRPIGWRLGTPRISSRGPGGVTTTPFYVCHELVFNEPRVLARMIGDLDGRVKRITPEELATTKGGTQEGRTRDGHVLFSNVFSHRLIESF